MMNAKSLRAALKDACPKGIDIPTLKNGRRQSARGRLSDDEPARAGIADLRLNSHGITPVGWARMLRRVADRARTCGARSS